ncbi:coiled-coil domain-containing protein 66 isoform X2 [Carcharodon carcharias]|uniref:coiled-coil domain-containing protein 66 isoform X2 n=1 Tax=Carcharodon carcharias TaxID=13397 RepID=UPI001B7F01B6|nr:coiled-coil domain-containing protein 66 isoform X2 [Carcharodon carcharias]
MNLGDGLKLERHFLNGKPKLILASYDASSKDAKRIKYKNRTTTQLLRSKQVLQEVPSTHESNSETEKPLLKHTVTNSIVASGKGENAEQLITVKKTDNKTKNNGETAKNGQPGTKATVKTLVITKQQPPKKQKISEVLKESLVCLTQEQLQQILASISQVNENSNQNQQRVKSTKPGKEVKEAEATHKELKGEENATLKIGVDCANNEASQDRSSSQKPQATNKSRANVEQSNPVQTEKTVGISASNQVRDGLFRHLGERENEKDQLEARRIQWKKELDEQVALKKLLEKDNAASEFLEWNPWGRPGAGAPLQSKTEKILATYEAKTRATLPAAYTDGRVISTAPTVVSTASTTVPADRNVGKASSFSSPDLPAAIRSAFVLGESVPLEHPFSAIKREQQKKWLQELDKQREEEKNRKLQEKLKYTEGDDHNRWAMHFDSYQKKPDQQTPVFVNTCGPTLKRSSESGHEQQSALSELQQFPSQAVSVLSHPTSSTGENTGSIGVDMGSDVLPNTHKTSFLRSMTALLDPAQIEERDLRRKKQREHQKAIAIQVEERRRQKQLEEDQIRKEEQKEELRLAKERERLRQQYEEETRVQREKEELHNRKTNLLYETVQRAQEEAQRQKQEQRIRELVRKGHDISNLQKNVEDSISRISPCTVPNSLVCEEVGEVLGQVLMEKDSPRKDRCIQTEDFELIGKIKDNAQVTDHIVMFYAPNTAAECNTLSNTKKPKEKPSEKIVVIEKENVLLSDDSYNQFARTKKGKNEKRPEWNTNKTNKRYVPASERYPKGLQREREEKKMKRQMELLQLLEKNAPEHRTKKKQPSKEPPAERLPSPVVPALQAKVAVGVSPQPVEKQGLSVLQQDDPALRSNSNSRLPADKGYSLQRTLHLCSLPLSQIPELKGKGPWETQQTENELKPHLVGRAAELITMPAEGENIMDTRGDATDPVIFGSFGLLCVSPPVPALRNKYLQMERKELHAVPNMNASEWCQRTLSANEPDNDRPPSSNFVPYVRTDEVYHLDPDAPMSRPSTNDPQYKHCNVTDHRQHQSYGSDHPKDPLLNPDLVRNRERQQAILKGLSELRQGLMQKQRELETGLTSSPVHQDEQYSVPSQHL